jgi:hypothetical protein
MPFKDKEIMREYQRNRYKKFTDLQQYDPTILDKLMPRLVVYFYYDINSRSDTNPKIETIIENSDIPFMKPNMTPYEKAIYYLNLFEFLENHPTTKNAMK